MNDEIRPAEWGWRDPDPVTFTFLHFFLSKVQCGMVAVADNSHQMKGTIWAAKIATEACAAFATYQLRYYGREWSYATLHITPCAYGKAIFRIQALAYLRLVIPYTQPIWYEERVNVAGNPLKGLISAWGSVAFLSTRVKKISFFL